MILNENIYGLEEKITMLCPYLLKAFEEQLNAFKVDYDGVTPMYKFVRSTTDTILKNHHMWVCPVYVLNTRIQGNIYDLHKCEPNSCTWIYISHSPFHTGPVDMILNPSTGQISP